MKSRSPIFRNVYLFHFPTRNTPLHYAASRREQHESCWVLLQYGAMVSRQNAKLIRPIDLLPVCGV